MTGEVELLRLQLQRGRIDAVAQAGRAGTVLEDVAEMDDEAKHIMFGHLKTKAA